VYTASLTTARHHASVPGVGGATAPFTTSTAPTSVPPREVEGESEKPHAPVPAQVGGYRLYKPVHEEEGRGAGWVEASAGVRPVVVP